MRSYGRLIRAFFRQSLQKEMAFRANFLLNGFHSLLGVVGGLGGVIILFSQKETLNGWSFAGTLALLGVYLLVQALKNLVIGPSLSALAGLNGDLWTGKFDFVLLKPVPTQFYISVRNWRVWAFLDLMVSGIVLGIAFAELRLQLVALDLLLFLVSLFIALILVYSILLILCTTAFWYLGTPLMWIFNDLMQLGRFPVGIYPGFLKIFLTWVIPIGFIVTVPAEALLGRVELGQILGGALLAADLFLLAAFYFTMSLRKYASASS